MDMGDCSTGQGCPWLECLLEQILVVVANTPLGEMQSIPLLRAVEDWSGAGFRTKQPLNAGQPAVSQVVNAPNTTKAALPLGQKTVCGGGDSPLPSGLSLEAMRRRRAHRATCAETFAEQRKTQWAVLPGPSCGLGQEWQTGKQVQHSAVMGSGMLWVATPSVAGASGLRGSGPPEEFSFPPDVDGFGGPWIGMSRWWRGPSARQGSVASTLMVSLFCALLD